MNHDLSNPVVNRVYPKGFEIVLNDFANTTVA